MCGIAARVVISAALLLGSTGVWAGCLPLTDPDYRLLDSDIATSPERALREANDRLDHLHSPGDVLAQAQLYAVVSEAHANLDQSESAKAAIIKGLELLKSSPQSETASRVRLRLELLRTELDSVAGNGAAAGAAIDKLLVGLPDDSIERACALSQRAIAHDFDDEPDRAVADALTAYESSRSHGWDMPRMETAYTLAVNFRRAGLYDQAEKMIDEVIAIETADGKSQNLPEAYYERGQLLVAARRFADARAALTLSRDSAAAIGDRLGAAAANIPLCLAQLDDHGLQAAQVTCNVGKADLIAGNRLDLATLLDAYRARLDLERHRPAAALAMLDEVLSQPIHRLLPVQEAQIHRDRARALGELHRYFEAFDEMSRAQSLDVASGIEQRHRQVAVMSALIESEQLRADNRLLEQHVQSQQRDLIFQTKARRLWTAAAVTSAIACGIFAYSLVLGRRHGRRLRRYEIILRHAGDRAPHAMVLLDENRRVCFANRRPLGAGSTPVRGSPVADLVPPDLLGQVMRAIDRALETNRCVTLDVALHETALPDRYYELIVLPAVDSGETLGVTLQSIDVTELRALERQFLDRSSQERRKFGGELHEGLAQELAGTLLMLGNLSNILRGESPAGVRLVAEIAEQVARSIGAARRMAQDLAPVMVERGSLGDALQWLAVSAESRIDATVSLDCRIGGCKISDLAADHIYQFCSEAVVNTALGETCRRVKIELQVIEDSLVIRISGDRRTVSAQNSPWDESNTKRMAFRARLLGGVLGFESTAGAAVSATLTVPVAQLQDDVSISAP